MTRKAIQCINSTLHQGKNLDEGIVLVSRVTILGSYTESWVFCSNWERRERRKRKEKIESKIKYEKEEDLKKGKAVWGVFNRKFSHWLQSHQSFCSCLIQCIFCPSFSNHVLSVKVTVTSSLSEKGNLFPRQNSCLWVTLELILEE